MRETGGRKTSTRHYAPMQPQPQRVVAHAEYRAVTIPWTKARATGALAGLLARGSKRNARTFPDQRDDRANIQWLLPLKELSASHSPLTVAGTAADLGISPHRIPIQAPRGTDAIIAD
jgi:hypothetical protein